MLDSEGIFEALHARLQVLNLPLLLRQEQVFDPFEAFRHLLVQCLYIFFAGHGAYHQLR